MIWPKIISSRFYQYTKRGPTLKSRILPSWIIAGIFFCLVPALSQMPTKQTTSGRLAVSVPVGETSKFTLATVPQGREVLGRIDAYIQNQTAWERGARMNKIAEVSAEDYAKFCQQQVLDWTDAERRAMSAAMKTLAEQVKPYARWMPPEVLIVKTSGHEEYGGAYTRSNAIMIESYKMRGYVSAGVLAHELWHVISRHRTELRDEMYAVLGFHYCGPVQWTAPLDRLRVTNPDCPLNQHSIKIRYKGQEYMAMPIMYAKTERFGIDVNNRLGIFKNARLLLVKPTASGTGVEAVMKNDKPLLLNFGKAQNFREQVGYNTDYLDHPEETIADNFEILVGGRKPRSPEITARLKNVLLSLYQDKVAKEMEGVPQLQQGGLGQIVICALMP